MQFVAPYSLVPAATFVLRFHPDHLTDLRASGLSDGTIKAAGVYSMRPGDIAHFFNLRRGVPSEIQSTLCFPYQGGSFARIKLFSPLGKMKCSQPPKTGARLYMPFVVCNGPTLCVRGREKNPRGVSGRQPWRSGKPMLRT